MINVITEHGSSFKGLAAYLLHDVDRESSDRVAWTETHGLATDDPERAWRIMTATAKSQAELKADAGVANTGRKSHKHVMHYVLSWHPEEREELTRDEMLSAAKASMTYLGTYEGEKLGKGKKAKRTQHADEHQAVIVCHDEGGDKPLHVHVMLNRVHPEHGVMLPDSKDYEKLSAWALDYRTAQGKEDYCPQRVQNAAKKAEGIVTSNPRKPRNIYEQEQAIEASDPASRRRAQLVQHMAKAKELRAKHEQMKERHAAEVRELEDKHWAAERDERAKTGEAIRSATSGIRSEYASKMDDMTARQAQEIDAFDEAKSTALGHARNAWAAFKTKAWMNEIRTKPLEAMKHGFALAFSSGLQQQDIEAQHQKEQDAMTAERRAAERDAAREARMDEGFRLDDLRQNYHEQRGDLVFKHGMDAAKMKTEWRQLDHDRLASEAEDYRRQAPDADADQGGGKKPDRQIEDPAPDLAQDFEPANDNAYDVPIDELRDIDAIRQEQLDWVDQEWQLDPDPDGNEQDFDRE